MRTWIVRLGSLYVFNVAVLLVIGAILPRVRVGWAALWASVILTLATVFLKPLISGLVAKGRDALRKSSRVSEKLLEYGAVFVVALIVWRIVVAFSGARESWGFGGFVQGWIISPLLLLLAWAIYDVVDDKIEAKAGEIYDRTQGSADSARPPAAPDVPRPGAATTPSPPSKDPYAGLTPEQRRMFEDL